MGSSEGGDGGLGVECGVGTIVWVRRRNGSWWPGRILGQHELSASHLMSPRSGTPVKLLGREDASVDWYNLEKSKRVKAFRCGEFDACIERAEASLGGPMRKREKYARREDAILHALELEKRQHEVKEQTSPLLMGHPKPVDGSIVIKPKFMHSMLTRDDETFGTMPRVKSSQKKLERTKPSIMGDPDEVLHDNSSSVKRKRSQGALTEDSLTKRKDRRRPLAQVLKSSAKLEVLAQSQPSDSNSEDKFLPEDSAGNSSDQIPISLVDYGFATNGLQVLSSSAEDTASSEMEAEDFLLQEAESFLEDEDALGKIDGGDGSLSNDEVDGGTDQGMSKWHLKGKRNVRAQPFYPKRKRGTANRFFNGGEDDNELSEASAFRWISPSTFWAVDDEDLPELPHGRALVEVDLKVQTTYQGERVPLVSLMSRLNGKAIIGHPVLVEILEDGKAADLVSEVVARRALGGSINGHPAASAPMWRTGRRTVMQRVPRAQLGLSTEEAEFDGSYPESLREPPHSNSAARKKVAAAKARKKLQKKGMISLSSQKTRTLSSIVTERRRSSKSRHGGGGLIKPGSSTVPPVTCVPIKVVFSRIMEAVGRPPSSTAVTRRNLPAAVGMDARPSSSSSSLL